MFASPRDYASYEIFFLGVYDRLLTDFIKAHLPEGGVSWDIGTERGWFTLLMASLVGPRGRVDAFEAFPPNYRKLESNLVLNNFTWVNPNNLAVSNMTGLMHFVPPSDEITHHVGYLKGCGGVGYLTPQPIPGSIVVATVSLDEYAERQPLDRLDIIKMDIEGAEHAALVGAARTIHRFRPKIAVEYNRECARRAGTSIEDLDQLLDSYKYDRFTFFGRLERLRLEKWNGRPDNETVFNVYCLPRG
jgi:FkbM family methyltransferase